VSAQIRLDEPVSLIRDDRFVIRSYSPVRTIGGGKVLNPIPSKHKRFQQAIIDGLNDLVDATPKASSTTMPAWPARRACFRRSAPDDQPADKGPGRNDRRPCSTARPLPGRQREPHLHPPGRLRVPEAIEPRRAGAVPPRQSTETRHLQRGVEIEVSSQASGKLFTLVLNRMIKENQLVSKTTRSGWQPTRSPCRWIRKP
jgi:hypothetical protein